MVKLEDYSVSQIKGLISQINKKVKISGYSKLDKGKLISKLRNHPQLKIIELKDKVKIKVITSDSEMKMVKKPVKPVKKPAKKPAKTESILGEEVAVAGSPVKKKKERSAKQKANDKRLGEMAKKRAKDKKK